MIHKVFIHIFAACNIFLIVSVCRASIIFPAAPAGTKQIVSENVARLLRSDPGFLGGIRADDLEVTRPHRWYSVGLTNLADGKLLSAAKMITWRFILMRGTNAIGLATVSYMDAVHDKQIKFGTLFTGCFSKETLKAIHESDKYSKIQNQDYELRFLDIPAIDFASVWLHGKSDHINIIIPLPPTYGKMNAYQPYSESQIMQFLKPEAEIVLKSGGGVGGVMAPMPVEKFDPFEWKTNP
jgi:hypothetical protein